MFLGMCSTGPAVPSARPAWLRSFALCERVTAHPPCHQPHARPALEGWMDAHLLDLMARDTAKVRWDGWIGSLLLCRWVSTTWCRERGERAFVSRQRRCGVVVSYIGRRAGGDLLCSTVSVGEISHLLCFVWVFLCAQKGHCVWCC